MTPPTPSSASKISTCPTSRSAAPRRRSPARPASRRSAEALLADPTLKPEAEAAAYVNSRKAGADTQGRPRRRPPDPDGAVLGRCRLLGEAADLRCRDTAASSADRGRGQGNEGAKIPRLLRATRKRSRPCPRIAPWRCFAGATKGMLQAVAGAGPELDDAAAHPTHPCEAIRCAGPGASSCRCTWNWN
jgi:hypothetical protein